MKKVILKNSFSRMCLFSFLFLCCLYISENAVSRNHWSPYFMEPEYDSQSKTLNMYIQVFDYVFGPVYENGFLQYGDIMYSTDGVNYTHLMRIDVRDQKSADWTWVIVRFKREGEKIQFTKNCLVPGDGSFWPDDVPSIRLKVKTDLPVGPMLFGYKKWTAHVNILWTPTTEAQDFKFIRFKGFWWVNGVYKGDKIDHVYQIANNNANANPANPNLSLKIQENNDIFPNNAVKVSTKEDAVVIKGAILGENLKIYDVSGRLMKSIVTDNDEVLVKLPANQVYIVTVGQARYKVKL